MQGNTHITALQSTGGGDPTVYWLYSIPVETNTMSSCSQGRGGKVKKLDRLPLYWFYFSLKSACICHLLTIYVRLLLHIDNVNLEIGPHSIRGLPSKLMKLATVCGYHQLRQSSDHTKSMFQITKFINTATMLPPHHLGKKLEANL